MRRNGFWVILLPMVSILYNFKTYLPIPKWELNVLYYVILSIGILLVTLEIYFGQRAPLASQSIDDYRWSTLIWPYERVRNLMSTNTTSTAQVHKLNSQHRTLCERKQTLGRYLWRASKKRATRRTRLFKCSARILESSRASTRAT